MGFAESAAVSNVFAQDRWYLRPESAAAGVVTAVTGAGLLIAGKEGGRRFSVGYSDSYPWVGVLKNGITALKEARAASRWFTAAERYLY
jgi:hypothetical protein